MSDVTGVVIVPDETTGENQIMGYKAKYVVDDNGKSAESHMADKSIHFTKQEVLQETHDELQTAIETEANDRQTQVSYLNGQIAETNRVLSGHVTQRLTTGDLSDLSDDGTPVYTPVLKSVLNENIPLIPGGSWLSDAKGRLGVYGGDFDADTAAFRTVTTSGGGGGVNPPLHVQLYAKTIAEAVSQEAVNWAWQMADESGSRQQVLEMLGLASPSNVASLRNLINTIITNMNNLPNINQRVNIRVQRGSVNVALGPLLVDNTHTIPITSINLSRSFLVTNFAYNSSSSGLGGQIQLGSGNAMLTNNSIVLTGITIQAGLRVQGEWQVIEFL